MLINDHTSECINHLCQLHRYLNSGVILEAAKDWLRGEISSMERDLGLEPIREFDALDRFERPMSWENPLERTIAGRTIREDEMVDYKRQVEEELLEQYERNNPAGDDNANLR
jgi:hypothetical protein